MTKQGLLEQNKLLRLEVNQKKEIIRQLKELIKSMEAEHQEIKIDREKDSQKMIFKNY